MVESLVDSISSEGMPKPNLDTLGDEFATAFDRWLVDFVYWLRKPIRAPENGANA